MKFNWKKIFWLTPVVIAGVALIAMLIRIAICEPTLLLLPAFIIFIIWCIGGLLKLELGELD